MSSAWLSAAIQEFEQVSLENGTELFRVRARAPRGDDPEPRPVLEAREHNGVAEIYEPLSSGGDRRGLMRLAYTVPTDRVGHSTVFSLRLPDGYRIELPEPTAGESRSEAEDGQLWQDAEPEPKDHDVREPDHGATQRIAELEQELAELRSTDGELQRRLTEFITERELADTAAAQAHEELTSLRASHGAVEGERQATGTSLAQALSELELARAERDTARQAAESAQVERDTARQAAESAQAERDTARGAAESAQAERDSVLETTRDQRAEHGRLTARVRQLQARIELLRADATGTRRGADPRLRQLETEREQLATHVRALAELLSVDGPSGDAGGASADSGAKAAQRAADRLDSIRARAVREANEQAERELRQLRAGTPL